MAASNGRNFGPYEILSQIGAGGMCEVYRARDTRLGRDVAVKVLPEAYSENAERLSRFEQEACAAGALNHPNILVIYDVGKDNGAPYVVSELLEGETLREKLDGAPLPQRKAIDYGLQIANGLAAAHEKGIVHRDLKPENLFVTDDGRLKILDFGLAKLTEIVNTESQSDIPTRRVATDPGAVMGTAGYMAPEQVRGQKVDHRADIFSFGCILYEMLTGTKAFRGESAADTMSAILREDPTDLSTSNGNISPGLERVVLHCLEKNPAERFQSARDLAFALEALSGSGISKPDAIAALADARVRWRTWLPWLIAGASVLVAAFIFVLPYFRSAPARPSVIRAMIPPPENAHLLAFNMMAVSPDGLRIAFVAIGS